jgi:hypothetical protein
MTGREISNWAVTLTALLTAATSLLGWWDNHQEIKQHGQWIGAVADVQHDALRKQWFRDHPEARDIPATQPATRP